MTNAEKVLKAQGNVILTQVQISVLQPNHLLNRVIQQILLLFELLASVDENNDTLRL